MKPCNKMCGGTPACVLGESSHSNKVQIKGLTLTHTSTRYKYEKSITEAPLKKHKMMVIVKSPDYGDYNYIGTGRNIGKLKELINHSFVKSDDIYITSLVKCIPPKKRKPTVQEVKTCMGHLADELRVVDPDVIVLMGTEALRAFNLTGEGGINALHGKKIVKQFPHDETLTKEYNLLVTSDPNALFLDPDPKLESVIIRDLRIAKHIAGDTYDEALKSQQNIKYKVIETLEDLDEMIAAIKTKEFFAFDTESRGLPWSTEPMICASFCWGYGTDKVTAAVLPIYKHDPNGTDWKLMPAWQNGDKQKVIDKLKIIFEDPKLPKVAHNIKYDMCVLRKHLGINVHGFLFDTLLMHHVLWEHPPHDLEYLADLEYNTGDYSFDLHQITGWGKVLKATYDNVPDAILWPYAAMDAQNVFRLMTLYWSRFKNKGHLWKLYQEEVHPFIRTLCKAEWFGARLDQATIDELTTEFQAEQDTLLEKILANTWPEFKPLSYQDVIKAVEDKGFGERLVDKSKPSGYNTNKVKLMELADDVPFVEDIIKYRTLRKLTSTYMCNAKEMSAVDGKARISVLIHGTVNGRPSCSFLHQIPRLDQKRIDAGKKNLRDMFVASPGYKLVYGDFSQLELVILAIQAGDSEMLKVFNEGGDIHTVTTAAFLECEPDKVLPRNRAIGKSVNFGRVYGAVEGYSLKKLTYIDNEGRERPLTDTIIRKGFASIDAQFPLASRYFLDTVIDINALNGVYITRFGREKRMTGAFFSNNEYAKREAERQAVNGSIQSPAASVTIRTLNEVDALLNKRVQEGELKEEDAYLMVTVHDSGLWEVKEELVDWFVANLKRISNRPIPELDDYQFKMNIGVGRSWSEAELNSK